MTVRKQPVMKKPVRPRSKEPATDKPETALGFTKRYHEDRKIPYDFAVQNGVKAAPPSEARAQGYKPALAGFILENINPFTGSLSSSSKIRYQHPPLDSKGKPVKFKALSGGGSDPFHARAIDWQKIARDTKISIVISEGELRSIAGALHNIPVIGCNGIEGVFEPGSQRKKLHHIISDNYKLKGRAVYLAFDCDAESNHSVRDAESACARLLNEAGANVYVVRIPRVTEDGKSGLDDLWAVNGGPSIFRALCAAAPRYNDAVTKSGAPSIECLADVEQQEVSWLSKPWLTKGMLNGLEGHPGGGKTFVFLKAAANGSRGRDPFTGATCKPFSTLYMSNENITGITTKARFKAMGGNEKRFFVLNGALNVDGTERPITLVDVDVIERAVTQTGAELVGIDPFQSYLGSGVDSHKSNETRPLLDALAKMAERQNVCVVIVRHLAKGSGNRAILQGLGSVDIVAAMRSVLMVGTAPDDPQNRALVHVKSNIGPIGESLSFVIEGKDAATKLSWKGKSQLTAADFIAAEGPKRKSKVELATDYLFDQLESGPRLAKDLESEGLYDERTLQRAAQKIGVVKSKRGDIGGAWEWQLPHLKFMAKKEQIND